MIITCLCYPAAAQVSCGSQHNAREISWTQRLCVCVCVCKRAARWMRGRERDNLHFQLITFSHQLLRPSGLKLKGQVLSAQTHAHTCTHSHRRIEKDTSRHTVANWESESGGAGGLEWMRGKKAHHCGRWLAHFHFNYTAQWHCCAYTLTHKHAPTHGDLVHAHTHKLYPMNSHQPRLWALHQQLQTESVRVCARACAGR